MDRKIVSIKKHRLMIAIQPEFLKVQVMQGEHWSAGSCLVGVPPDALLIRSFYDAIEDIFGLVFEHPSFPLVLEGGVIPRLTPQFKNDTPA